MGVYFYYFFNSQFVFTGPTTASFCKFSFTSQLTSISFVAWILLTAISEIPHGKITYGFIGVSISVIRWRQCWSGWETLPLLSAGKEYVGVKVRSAITARVLCHGDLSDSKKWDEIRWSITGCEVCYGYHKCDSMDSIGQIYLCVGLAIASYVYCFDFYMQ